MRFVKDPVEAEKLPLTPKFPVKVSVVFFKGVYPNVLMIWVDVKFEALKGIYPIAFVMFAAVKFASLNGVYPRAVVMSDDDKENEAVKLDKPSLVRVSVFMVEAESEKEIPVT